MESYYRLQYEILRLIDDGKISEAQQYLWKKVHQQDTDALAIIGFLYFYGVGLKKMNKKEKNTAGSRSKRECGSSRFYKKY